MPFNDQPPRLDHSSSRNPLATILSVIVGAGLLVAGFFFSIIILAIVAVIGLGLWGYLWWKTRALRSNLREQMEQMQREQQSGTVREESTTEGVIIEGEVIREESDDARR